LIFVTYYLAEMIAEKRKKNLPLIYSPSKLDPAELVRHQGKYIAIWENKIIGSGDNEHEARARARQLNPDAIPTVCGIPPKEGLIAGLQFA
jgi:hypothetical protein